ncbi:MAG: BrnA antitoxin family protein [Rhodospirillales bacterium]
MSEADIRRAAAADPDAGMTPDAWWKHARIVVPAATGKESVTIRLDRDLLAWFRKQGRGYQTKINAVLRAFVESQGGRS